MVSRTGTVASSTTIAPNAQDLASALAITARFTALVVMTITTAVTVAVVRALNPVVEAAAEVANRNRLH